MGIAKTKLPIQTTAITDNENNFPGLLRKGYMIARYLKGKIKIHLYLETNTQLLKGNLAFLSESTDFTSYFYTNRI